MYFFNYSFLKYLQKDNLKHFLEFIFIIDFIINDIYLIIFTLHILNYPFVNLKYL